MRGSRLALVLVLAAGAGGCSHLFTLDGSDFDASNVSSVRFAHDNDDCGRLAVVAQNEAGENDARYKYNRAYAACMQRLGYHRQGAFDLF